MSEAVQTLSAVRHFAELRLRGGIDLCGHRAKATFKAADGYTIIASEGWVTITNGDGHATLVPDAMVTQAFPEVAKPAPMSIEKATARLHEMFAERADALAATPDPEAAAPPERLCAECGDPIAANKPAKQRTCSRACGQALRRREAQDAKDKRQ